MNAEHTTITTQEQYDAVAARLEELKNAPAGSEGAKELKLLTKLIVEFERKRSQSVQKS